jgi:hypothetical protein
MKTNLKCVMSINIKRNVINKYKKVALLKKQKKNINGALEMERRFATNRKVSVCQLLLSKTTLPCTLLIVAATF